MFCWNKNWIQTYESPWSLFEKFKYANEINSIELLRTLGTTQVKMIKTRLRGRGIRNLYTLEGFEEELLTSAFQSNIVEINKNNLDKITSVLNSRDSHYRLHFNDNFVYCPMCLQEGLHSLFHQFKLIHECPFHHIKLENVCLNCRMIFPYELWYDKDIPPYTCQCGYTFFSSTVAHLFESWSKSKQINAVQLSKWLQHASSGYKLFFFKKRIFNLENGIDLALSALEQVRDESPVSLLINGNIRFNCEHSMLTQKKLVSEGMRFNDEIYATVLEVFKSIDLNIKKRVRTNHKKCLHVTRKFLFRNDFKRTCEFSTSYMIWRNSILTNSEDYNKIVNLSAKPTKYNYILNFPTQLIKKELSDFIHYWRINQPEDRQYAATLKWLIAKLAASLILKYWDICQEAIVFNRCNGDLPTIEYLRERLSVAAPTLFITLPRKDISSDVHRFLEFKQRDCKLQLDSKLKCHTN
ncbi:TniQ family protein [Paenibacillus sp. CGMCC 1.16610]|uniref:TniQ domain-containing protein n=1 Tax=Paenibacillus anseongense TaxID=2682845 RepID=A0ABW9UJ23_9BACL|nr:MULTISPECIES: TniQ family protein [Paenibacillus]MBA2941053.1 TniQ family protein [Paenibacillus sp. CGMCC 1.16610]MVQ39873.1 hypothetical protein [Paenibacillus anseongense]